MIVHRSFRELYASFTSKTENICRGDIHALIFGCPDDGLYLRVRIGRETVQRDDAGDVELADVFVVFPQICHTKDCQAGIGGMNTLAATPAWYFRARTVATRTTMRGLKFP